VAADHVVGRRPSYEIHAPPPVEYLVAHSMELALKSYLLFGGMSLREVERHRHDLVKLWGSATRRGIGDSIRLSDEELALLGLVSDRHTETLTRYIVTGWQTKPVFGPLQQLAEKLLNAICSIIGYRR